MSGPAVPPNEAVPTINSKRLLRFSRPFQPSTKKGAAPSVAPRKWRSDDEEQQQQQQGNDQQKQQQGNRSYANSVIVTKDLIEQFASKLNVIEKDRALKGLEPIPVNSAAAGQARLERFMGSSDKMELDRSRRFGNLDAAGADLVGSAPNKPQQQQQRSRSGGKGSSNTNQQQQAKKDQPKKEQPKKADAPPPAPLDEAAQKRLARFTK